MVGGGGCPSAGQPPAAGACFRVLNGHSKKWTFSPARLPFRAAVAKTNQNREGVDLVRLTFSSKLSITRAASFYSINSGPESRGSIAPAGASPRAESEWGPQCLPSWNFYFYCFLLWREPKNLVRKKFPVLIILFSIFVKRRKRILNF